jgi:hypothetical protein
MTRRDEAAYVICTIAGFVIMMCGWLITGVPVPWWEPFLMLEIPTYFLSRSCEIALDAGAGFEPATYGL